jgi:hypothetical protein
MVVAAFCGLGMLFPLLAILFFSTTTPTPKIIQRPTTPVKIISFSTPSLPAITGAPAVIPSSAPTATPLVASATLSTPTPLPTAETAPTATLDVEPGQLAGLWATDVVNDLENKGFACASTEDPHYHIWSCDRSQDGVDFHVDFYGVTPSTVDYIHATSNVPNPDEASLFLSYIAALSFEGAEPDAARDWVKQTIHLIAQDNDRYEAGFGGVQYQLSGFNTRSLQIGSLPK